MNQNVRSTTSMLRLVGAFLVCLMAGLTGLAQTPGISGTPIVADVLVRGNRNTPAEHITGIVETRPGTRYRPNVVQGDVRKLMGTGRFGNIEVRTRSRGDGKIDVIFIVLDYPSVIQEIQYVGAKEFDADDLDIETELLKGAPLNPMLNKTACQRIVRAYQSKGYPFASCTLREGGRVGDRRVVFNITEGPRVYVSKVDFVLSSPTGSPFVSKRRLRTLLLTKKMLLKIPFLSKPYSPQMVQRDIDKLHEYYRSFGFHDVAISRELKWNLSGRTVELIFHIREGHRYRVKRAPKIVGDFPFPKEEIERLVYVKGGEHYDSADISSDVTRIRNYIGYTGRQARVTEKVVFHGATECQVNYEVEVQPQSRVGDIIIIGNTTTKQNVILRQVPLFPGQILSYPELRQAERNLARLGIFEMNPATGQRPTVMVRNNPENPNSEFKDVIVRVDETRTGSLLFGVGFNSDAGATGSIVLNERNFDITNIPTSFAELFSGRAFRGAGQEFRLEAVPGTELQRYTISFREPFLFDSDYSFSASGYIYTRRFDEYDEGRQGGRLAVSRRLNDYWRASLALRMENVEVSRVAPFAPIDYRSVVGDNSQFGLRLGFTRDTRDSIIRATEGSRFDVGVEGITGDQSFPIFTADYTKYFTTFERNDGSGRQVIALRSQVGYAPDAPVYERFFAGGFRTIRGFDFRGVGPDVTGFKVGGEFLLLNSIEYQVPLTANDQIVFVAFVDSGTVERDLDIDEYRVSAGFGFRLTVPFMGQVPIALDFGFPILKGDADRTQVFNFYLGINR